MLQRVQDARVSLLLCILCLQQQKPWSHHTGLQCRVWTTRSCHEHNVSTWSRVLEAGAFLRAHAGKWRASWNPCPKHS